MSNSLREDPSDVRVSSSGHDRPVVSIVTVVLNNKEHLANFLQRIERLQRREEIELIIIDGGSTDGTLDLLGENAQLVSDWVSEQDQGIYDAMNKGISRATGRYVATINADDYILPENFDAVIAGLNGEETDIVACAARMVRDGDDVFIRHPRPLDETLFFRTIPFSHNAIFVAKALYDRLGPYRTDLTIVSDLEFYYRAYAAGAQVRVIQTPIIQSELTGLSGRAVELLHDENNQILAEVFPFLERTDTELLIEFRTSVARNNIAFDFSGLARLIEVFQAHGIDLAVALKLVIDDAPKLIAGKDFIPFLNMLPRSPKLQRRYLTSPSPEDTDPDLVTIGIAAHNCADTIERAVNSALSQTWANIEVIVVDDASTDTTFARLEELKSVRVRIYRNEQNEGVAAVRNRIAALARGTYIMFCDDDDESHPERAEQSYRKVKAIEQETIAEHVVCFSSRNMVSINGKVTYIEAAGTDAPISGSDIYRLIFANLARVVKLQGRIGRFDVAAPRAMGAGVGFYPTAFVRKYGFHETFRRLEDLEICAQAADKIAITGVEEPLYTQYVTESSDKSEHVRSYYSLIFLSVLRPFFSGFEIPLSDLLHAYLAEADQGARSMLAVSSEIEYRGPNDGPELARFDEDATRVATMVVWDFGGAGQGSQRRVEALRQAGIRARIHCIFKRTNKGHVLRVPTTVTPDTGAENDTIVEAAWRDQGVLTKDEFPELTARELFSKTGSIVDFDDLQSVFDDSDIVHLHWVVGMFDYEKAPKYLAEKPLVWTLADMNAFTGGCHYSEGCDGYKQECRECPLLSGSDRAHQTWKKKKQVYDKINNLHVICPSQWLADRAKESALFKDRPIHVIPNAMPVDRFSPTNKLVARRKLGLPLDKKLVVFGAASVTNHRKGGDILQESIHKLVERDAIDDVEGIFFGANRLDIGVEAHNMGHIDNERKLSLVYAAADVYAFPSREDNAPLTVAEALLSGTPVVGFPVGNVPELVRHRENGYIAQYEDADDFAEGLLWALEDTRSAAALRRSVLCRTIAARHNDPRKAVERHVTLYQGLTE